MNVLFLVPYPVGEAPSQRFRFEQYFPFLEEKGIKYQVQSFIDDETWRILYQPKNKHKKAYGIVKGFIRRFKQLFALVKYDYVFIHREASPIGPPIFEWWIAKVAKKKIIYDFDDAIWLPNTSAENLVIAKIKWHHKVKQIASWSHTVSCGNNYLAKWASQWNTNVKVMPTTIDTENVHNIKHEHSPEKVTIGWTGTHSTAKYLQDIEEPLQKIAHAYPQVSFLFISNKPVEILLPRVQFIHWNKLTEIQDLNKIDIGLMPLTADRWSEGKCGFKLLQYMALGIPAVASPVGVNSKIIEESNAVYAASTASEWQKQLSTLTTDTGLRIALAAYGKAYIGRNYSTQSQAGTFINLFSR